MRCVAILMLLFPVLTCGAGAGPICDHIITYMQEVDRTAWWVHDAEERQGRYREALHRLVINVRRWEGMFFPCDELMKRAEEYQQHRETFRAPPAGWSPAPSKRNLMMFTDIAKLERAVHRGLTEFCESP